MRIPGEEWSQYVDGDTTSIDKETLAIRTIEQYGDLERVLGHTEAAREMALLLGQYVLAGELNQFEADMIGTLAILGNVATNALNKNERLKDGRE